MCDRHRKYEQGTQELMANHGVNMRVANDVMYLRNQPSWSQSKEDGFIEQVKTTGEIPDVRELV